MSVRSVKLDFWLLTREIVEMETNKMILFPEVSHSQCEWRRGEQIVGSWNSGDGKRSQEKE